MRASDPLVPVIVSVYVPGDAGRLAVTLIVEVDDVVLDGDNDALVLCGRPLADSDTLPAKPFFRVIVTV